MPDALVQVRKMHPTALEIVSKIFFDFGADAQRVVQLPAVRLVWAVVGGRWRAKWRRSSVLQLSLRCCREPLQAAI